VRVQERQFGYVPPRLDHDSLPWWEEIDSGRFTLPVCGSGHRWFPPTPGCPKCGSRDVRLESARTIGAVYSWVVVNRSLNPIFDKDAPYLIVAVDLADGGRMFGRLLFGEAKVEAGMAVRVEIYSVDGHKLVGFRPDGG
jgi:uncharacterized protein